MTPPSPRLRLRARSAIAAIVLAATASAATAEIIVHSGDKVAFLGDSITAAGWGNPAGYVKLVVAGLAANGVTVTPIPAGISGHKSNDMLARLDRDVLSKKPNWMTLSCGVNDVWHGKKGVPLDDAQAAAEPFDKDSGKEGEKGTYKKNITAIVDQASAAKVKVVMLTATVIHEELDSKENARLAPYNEFLRQLAKEKHLPMADLNALFQEKIKAANQPGKKVLTSDGVHMNIEGNKLMATGILTAFGLDAAQMKKAEEAWAPMEKDAQEAERKAAEARAKAAAEKAAKAAADKAAAEKAATDAKPATPAQKPAGQ